MLTGDALAPGPCAKAVRAGPSIATATTIAMTVVQSVVTIGMSICLRFDASLSQTHLGFASPIAITATRPSDIEVVYSPRGNGKDLALHDEDAAMESVIDGWLKDFEAGAMTRRELIERLLRAAAIVAAAPSVSAQTPPICRSTARAAIRCAAASGRKCPGNMS